MSDLEQAAETLADQRALSARASEALAAAYRAVLFGVPSPDDQVLVREDLEDFCGMRTAMLRPSFHETAEATGKFRVWQRIHAFCHPRSRRPADATKGGRDGETRSDERPIAGGGVAHVTVD
jgi:hypothetical protein